MVRKLSFSVLGLRVLASCSQAAQLGQVHFDTSCKATVQPRFDEAVALLHSFEFKEAEEAFAEVEKRDPTCSIAAWGMAFANTERLEAGASQKVLASGWQQLQPWLSGKAGTQREQMYLDAVRAMYEKYNTVAADVRSKKYLVRMNTIRRKYPRDINASLFYALGLLSAGKRREALSILLPIFHQYPDNPGAAHYIIHAGDTPELAMIALPAARKYAQIAPDSPHALHMPSHIFNQLGLWQESIHSNLASAQVASEWIKNGHNETFDELHALNNLEYGYLQLGLNDEARGIIRQIDSVTAVPGGDPWAGKDARIYYDVENHNWDDAVTLGAPAGSPFQENFDVYWLHAIAAARLGRIQAAETALRDFKKSSQEWTSGSGHDFAEGILHLALLQADAWVTFARGDRSKATGELQRAMRFERDHPMYYADILPRPSSEMLGDMFLQMGKPANALRAYQMSLKIAPNRFDSLRGAKTSAAQAGRELLSQEYAAKIASLSAIRTH
jgi:tetratricopeptide (TPR) repeat protein